MDGENGERRAGWTPWYYHPAWWGLLLTILLNTVVALWSYARLSQKVEDLDRLEHDTNNLVIQHIMQK